MEQEYKINKLCQSYARCLDERRYREWPEYFTDDAKYIIHSRENDELGYEAYLLYVEGTPMMSDRVEATLEALVYDPRYERRIVTDVMITGESDGCIETKSNYIMVTSTTEGNSELFSAGEIRDKIVFDDDGEPKFKERMVVPDTFNVVSTCPHPI